MTTELERYKEAVKVAIFSLRSLGLDYAHLAHAIEERINEALNPPPEYEEVEVITWAIVAPSGYVETVSVNECLQRDQVENENGPFFGYQVVKLTGTIKRPKPQKVERSVSVEVKVGDGAAHAKGCCVRTDTGAKRWEFADNPECHGKTGVLTFTWAEEAKTTGTRQG